MLTVAPFAASDAGDWDALVRRAPMGTLLHTRQFLGYHGDRLDDASLVVRDGRGRLAGVIPAAVDPGDGARVASHPGATFGGVVHDGSLAGAAMVATFAAIAEHYRERGFEAFRYAPVPFIYHERPSADDLYALFTAGAAPARCELSCAVDLESGPRLSSRRRRGLAKGRRAGVQVDEGPGLVDELWPLVEANLAERHGARPVHTVDEMHLLMDLFPAEISVVVARRELEPVAGVVLFETPRVVHVQYIASNPDGNSVGALDAVFDHCLARAAGKGARFFDFGTSNGGPGGALNEGLYEFKAQFGGGGVAYEAYDLELTR